MRANKPTILPRIGGNSGSSPYTYAYESLNGNSGGGLWRTVYIWRRFIIGGTLLVMLAWLTLRGTGSVGVEEPQSNPDLEVEWPRPGQGKATSEPHPPSPPRPPAAQPPANKPARPILTFEADHDPSSTSQCTTAHLSSDGSRKPIVQWALMIDAGSTGSRIHVYKFNNCLASPAFEYEVFKQIRPGLSSYASNPTQAAESLDSLLREAERVVPQKLWKCTPVAVKATAGLRLLGQEQSDAILEAVKGRLKNHYQFPVVHKDGVVVMDGKDEGVFAWITANYLLNTLPSNPSRNANKDKDTGSPYAVLDLGGASTQIVFKPLLDVDGDGIDDNHLEDGDHKYDLHFGSQTHVLYQHSYLGYGLMRARGSVHKLVEFMASFTSKASHSQGAENSPVEVPNPCIAKGMSRTVEVDISRTEEKMMRNFTMAGGDVGSWDACNRVLELVLAKDAVCHVKPCSFNGVYQPSLLDTFPNGPILLLSYFYDRIAPLITPPPTQPSTSSKSTPVDPTEDLTFPVKKIGEMAKAVCRGRTAWKNFRFPYPAQSPSQSSFAKWGDYNAVMEELEGRPEYCLDLSFMYALLRLGYEFSEDREVRIGKQVRGTELGWSLGAALRMLGEAEFECRA